MNIFVFIMIINFLANWHDMYVSLQLPLCCRMYQLLYYLSAAECINYYVISQLQNVSIIVLSFYVIMKSSGTYYLHQSLFFTILPIMIKS